MNLELLGACVSFFASKKTSVLGEPLTISLQVPAVLFCWLIVNTKLLPWCVGATLLVYSSLETCDEGCVLDSVVGICPIGVVGGTKKTSVPAKELPGLGVKIIVFTVPCGTPLPTLKNKSLCSVFLQTTKSDGVAVSSSTRYWFPCLSRVTDSEEITLPVTLSLAVQTGLYLYLLCSGSLAINVASLNW